jgi:hypothetical protein
MNELIDILNEDVKKYGERPMTNIGLLYMLCQARKRRTEDEDQRNKEKRSSECYGNYDY